jgi:hypothetical protein
VKTLSDARCLNTQRSPGKKENTLRVLELAMEKSVNGLDTVT